MARRSPVWGLAVAALVATACDGGDAAEPAAPHPLVADVPAALDAFAELGEGSQLFQVSGTPDGVEGAPLTDADASA